MEMVESKERKGLDWSEYLVNRARQATRDAQVGMCERLRRELRDILIINNKDKDRDRD